MKTKQNEHTPLSVDGFSAKRFTLLGLFIADKLRMKTTKGLSIKEVEHLLVESCFCVLKVELSPYLS